MTQLIADWNTLLQATPKPELFEAAFLRIYVEYESRLAKTFLTFSLGRSHGSYQPQRKLTFSDETQLTDLIRGESNYVDYIRAIPRCSRHIFLKDPFGTIFSATNYHDDLQRMKVVRNYLAHRSTEARGKYIASILNAGPFVEPGHYLQKRVNGTAETYYTKYCRILLEIDSFFWNDLMLSAI